MAIGPSQFRQLSVLGPNRLPRDVVFLRPAQVNGVIALTSGIHFRSLHARSFVLVLIFPWCRHGTLEITPSQYRQLSVLGPIASLETGYFDGPHRLVGLLHRLVEYISGLSMCVASLWY